MRTSAGDFLKTGTSPGAAGVGGPADGEGGGGLPRTEHHLRSRIDADRPTPRSHTLRGKHDVPTGAAPEIEDDLSFVRREEFHRIAHAEAG